MATETRNPDYSDEKRNNSLEIDISPYFFGIRFCKRYNYFCVFQMIIKFYNYLHDRT